MKLTIFIAIALVCSLTTTQAQYLETTRRTVPTQGDVTGDPCNATVARSFAFDFEPLRQGTQSLDIAVAKTVWAPGPPPLENFPLYYPSNFSYNVNGGFPSYSLFDDWSAVCSSPLYIKKVLFGRLRSNVNPPRRDLAVIRTGSPGDTRIYQNSMIPNFPLLSTQTLNGNAIDGTWGAFTSNDVLEDLALTEPDHPGGAQIRIYPNDGTGHLNVAGAGAFNYSAQQIVLAQINGPINAQLENNKLDLIGFDANQLLIWRNDNDNGLPNFPPYKQTITLAGISSLAVADINNDGWNDIVVGYNRGVLLFLNNQSPNGPNYIPSAAYWVYQIPVGDPSRIHLIAVGDLGSPASLGGGTRNDGWTDLVIADLDPLIQTGPTIRVFVNQRGSGQPPTYFTSFPQQLFVPALSKGSQAPCISDVKQIELADVQTNGGFSLVYSMECEGEIHFVWHLGDPAPAPPKNLSWSGSIGQAPTISWDPNTERDISGYKVYRKLDPARGFALKATVTVNSYTDNEIVIGNGNQGYAHYYVEAYDAASNISDPSATIDVPYGFQPGRPFTPRQESERPRTLALHPSYPNPFNPSTQIRFDLPEANNISLIVYDVLGRKVKELVNSQLEAGYHSIIWDATTIPSGVYFARFTVTNPTRGLVYSGVNRLLLMK